MDNVTNKQVGISLCAEFNRQQVFKAKESAGKSGSFFLFSFDNKFLIKTMNNSELAVFRQALPKYVQFLRKNPKSLIARIYGIFTVVMEDIVPVHLLLMSNSAQTGRDIENVFDLKGSIINREVHAKDIRPGGTLKDVNLLNLKLTEVFLTFQRNDMRAIMMQVFEDIRFLAKFNIMDYSLLLIVETNPQWKKEMNKAH
jgi:hypothetical protein